MSPEIRLACMICDRDDFDGTTLEAATAAGWQDIGPSVPLYGSQWWTHLGYCDECLKYAEEYRHELEDAASEEDF